MIKKKFRLLQGEVKKVLRIGKPFFSYGMIGNVYKNNLSFNRFALIIGSKTVVNSVERNFFRRLFYTTTSYFIFSGESHYDVVFVMKKKVKLNKLEGKSVLSFQEDICFILKKTLQKEHCRDT